MFEALVCPAEGSQTLFKTCIHMPDTTALVPRRSTYKPLSYRRDGRQTDGQTSSTVEKEEDRIVANR